MAASMISSGTLGGMSGAVSGGIPYAVERAWQAPVGARTRHALTGMRIGGLRLAILFGLAGFAYTPLYLCVGKMGLKDENRNLANPYAVFFAITRSLHAFPPLPYILQRAFVRAAGKVIPERKA
ncbi:hypothetical protein HHX47_DHR3000983 [Lentinula edodes]|nr:hypothetical protein HHX47_DHR3000983 [Lentinula edodes]